MSARVEGSTRRERPARPAALSVLALFHLPLALAHLAWDVLLVSLGATVGSSLYGLALLLRLFAAFFLIGSAIALWRGRASGRSLALFSYAVALIVNAKMLWTEGGFTYAHGETGVLILLVLRYGLESLVYVAAWLVLRRPAVQSFLSHRPRRRRVAR